MKNLDESIAQAMDCENPELVSYLPYILQDFYEIGSSANSILEIVNNNISDYHNLQILDLGCGKGAVSIKLSESLNCSCLGIDAINEFIEYANKMVQKRNLTKCKFITGDIRKKISSLGKYDVIVLGSIGPILGNYYETMEQLKNILNQKGIVILDDGYIDDCNDFSHELVSRKKQLIKEIEKAGMKIVNEYLGEEISNSNEYDQQLKDIIKRCHELKDKYPEKKELFQEYIRKQKEEYNNLDKEIVCSTMVITRK